LRGHGAAALCLIFVIPLLAGAAFTGSGAAASSGLVAAYSFDEGSGTAVSDASGNGNNGTTSNTAWTTGGRYGGALSFNGTSSWVTVPDAPELDLTKALTLEAWVKPTSLGTAWRNVIFKEQGSNMTYGLYAHEGSVPDAQVFQGAEQNARGTAALPANAWTFLSSTYDGSTLRLFVNGTQVASTPVTGALTVSNGVLHMGGNAVWGEWYAGLIDNVRIYNRALSAAELQSDMSSPVGAQPSAVRINAGGGAVTAANGDVYSADTAFTGGGTGSTAAAIGGTTDPALFKDERWGGWSYSIPVVNGTYDVKLSFVELWYAAPCAGKRVFSVDVTETAASPDIANLDVCAAVGPNTALVKTIPNVTVTDGVLDVKSIYGSADDPEITAIAVVPSGSTPPPPPPPPPATGDTQAPTAPGGLAKAASTGTSVSVSWNASTDNVGVTGYGLYSNGTSTGSTTSTTATFSGLTCGTTYTLAVDAFDKAGNRSAKSSISAATSACTTPPSGSASVFVSPSGSDSNPCTQSAPCGSFDRAYRVAGSGATVQVAGGSYGTQDINPDASKTSANDVVFQPAPGASVTVGSVDVNGADHLEIRDMRISGGWHTMDGTTDVTFRNIVGASFYIDSGSAISVIGGSYGPDTDLDNAQIRSACSSCATPSNILIDGVYFHDARITPGSDAHVECLQVGDINGLTVRNSTFVNCETHNIFISPWWTATVKDVLLENNFGGKVIGYYGFRIANGDAPGVCDNVVFRNNSATSPFLIECNTIKNGASFIANVGPYVPWACYAGITYRYNVWDGASCSSTDLNAPSGFVDPASGNLHLQPGAAAINRGDPSSYPAKDIDGNGRPMGGAPDAGADEKQ
jgi:chitodextrinase